MPRPSRESFNDFGGEFVEQAAIGGREEEVLPMVAAQGYVIERAWDVQTERAWHPCFLKRYFSEGPG